MDNEALDASASSLSEALELLVELEAVGKSALDLLVVGHSAAEPSVELLDPPFGAVPLGLRLAGSLLRRERFEQSGELAERCMLMIDGCREPRLVRDVLLELRIKERGFNVPVATVDEKQVRGVIGLHLEQKDNVVSVNSSIHSTLRHSPAL